MSGLLFFFYYYLYYFQRPIYLSTVNRLPSQSHPSLLALPWLEGPRWREIAGCTEAPLLVLRKEERNWRRKQQQPKRRRVSVVTKKNEKKNPQTTQLTHLSVVVLHLCFSAKTNSNGFHLGNISRKNLLYHLLYM